MAKERLKSPRARMFVALDLPDPVRSGIDRWGRSALSDPALRRMAPESLHMTLVFLGYRPEREAERLAAIVEASTTPAPLVELHGPVARPSSGRARLFALTAHSPGAVSLQAEIQERLVAEGLYVPEKRLFWPHVTVAKVRPETRGAGRRMRITEPPEALPEPLSRPFEAVRVTLYRSILQPQGALYTPLAQVELSEDGRQ